MRGNPATIPLSFRMVLYRSFLVLGSLLWLPQARAQAISLSPDQRAKLAQFVRDDPEAARLFNQLKRDADAATNDPGQPIVTIKTAGTLATDPAKIQSRASLKDMNKVNALGYASLLAPNAGYGAAVKRIILSWAEINQPTGIPVDETKLTPLWVAYDLTRSGFSKAECAVVDNWLRKIAAAEQGTANKKSATAMNNWNSHRLKIIGLIGFLLRDQNLIHDAVEGFKKQVAANLQPDGSSFDFHERDALHYHCYTLEPLLELAVTASLNGIDLYHYEAPSGASLPKSVAFLAPYCRGEKTHAEWSQSRVQFDRERAEAGETKFAAGSNFDPRDGRRVFELASLFSSQYQPLVGALSNGKAVHYPTWQMVVNAAYK